MQSLREGMFDWGMRAQRRRGQRCKTPSKSGLASLNQVNKIEFRGFRLLKKQHHPVEMFKLVMCGDVAMCHVSMLECIHVGMSEKQHVEKNVGT